MEVIIWIIVGFLYGEAMRVYGENRGYIKGYTEALIERNRDFNKKMKEKGTKMRNIDKIRQMTTDEMAEWIEQECKACYIQDGIYADVNNIKQWLEQESE